MATGDSKPSAGLRQQVAITRPHPAEQTEQAWCLTVLTKALVTTEYYTLAVRQLRADGRSVPDEPLSHVSPGQSGNINFLGVINVDIEAELANFLSQRRFFPARCPHDAPRCP